MAIATIVASSREPASQFDLDKATDSLFSQGLSEDLSEQIARTLQSCFSSQRFAGSYKAGDRKFALVRAGLPAGQADTLLAAIDPCIVQGRDREVRAPVQHVPGQGRVVMCDFRHLARPEMQKERRAIVISKRSASIHHRCVVIPVSKAALNAGHPLHHEFPPGKYPFFHQEDPVWAVCDHIYTVSLARIWQVNVNRRPTLPSLLPEDLEAVLGMVGTHIGT